MTDSLDLSDVWPISYHVLPDILDLSLTNPTSIKPVTVRRMIARIVADRDRIEELEDELGALKEYRQIYDKGE